MFKATHWWLVAAILALLAFASCGGGASSVNNPATGLQAGNGPAAQSAALLPDLPRESGKPTRFVSSGEGSINVLGKDFIQEQNATVDGNSLRLVSVDGEHGSAYGMYQLGGLSGKKPLVLTCQCTPDFEDSFFVAVADYTLQHWYWYGPFSLPEATIDLTNSSNRYITSLGNFYFVVVAHGGAACTHAQSSLTYQDADTSGGGDGQLPGAPYDLTASDGAFPNGVQVSWLGGDGAETFEVWRRLDQAQGDAEAWNKIAETGDMGYFDGSAAAGTVYRYKVRARNVTGESDYSNTDTGYAGDGGTNHDFCPSELLASDGTSAEWVELNWNPGAGDGAHFNIWRRQDGTDGDFVKIGDTNDHMWHDTTGDPGVWYIYKVERVGDGQSCFSNTDAGFRSDGQNTFCPSEFTASDGTNANGVACNWAPGTGDGTFSLWRRLPGDNNSFQLLHDGITGHEFLDTSAQVGVTYEYMVFKNGGGATCPSNSDTGYVAGGDYTCASELTASDGTSTEGVQLEWNPGTGAGTFAVLRKVAESADERTVIADGITGHTYFDTTATPGVVYNYVVRKTADGHDACTSNDDNGSRAVSANWCPTELTASDGTFTDSVHLTWNPGDGTGTFQIWRLRSGDGQQWTQVGTTNDHTYGDTALDAHIIYYYKVIKTADGHDNCESNVDSGYAGTI